MRPYIALAAILALTACGGGSGGGTTTPSATVPAPTPTPTGSAPASNYATPTFRITVPAPTGAATRRRPQFISSATQSITITLTADSAGQNPTTLGGNPATTNISGASCSSGCTVNGPTSPAGSDTYTLTTYDQPNGTGNALDTNSGTFTIVSGVTNTETITLNGIPAHILIPNLPAFPAGAPNSILIGATGASVNVANADGETITGQYANPVTISDPDTNGNGSLLTASLPCPPPPFGNPAVAPTQMNLAASTSSIAFCYGGVAENPVTLVATAPGVAAAPSIFPPILFAPAYLPGSGFPPSVVVGSSPPDIELYATSGLGSTGTVNYTEAGWTGQPYNQMLNAFANLACSSGSSFSNYATVNSANMGPATAITVTAAASPTAGACPLTVWDGLAAGLTTTTFASSYTTSGFTVNGRRRR